MSSTTPQDRPFVRAVRKIKCAAMVNSLAKSWQGWVNEHSDKQDTIPSGWMPDVVVEEDERTCKVRNEVKLQVSSRVVAVDSDSGGSKIRTGAVTKSMAPKLSECGNDMVSSIKDKIQMAPEEDTKPFPGKESPTRRRLSQKVGQDMKMGSRSSSLDTEDSGLGEETGLGDNNTEPKCELRESQWKKNVIRPKVKVTTIGDIKGRWQQWSKDHMASQKLNPFSEDFDYELAMAQRLQKGDDGYGRPKEGTKTAMRGDRAQKHVHKEMDEMCWIIRDMGQTDKEGRTVITFGRLFDRYVKISDKVVGILLRCRKHKMVDFEGEMLWKGQDDHVIIYLTD